MSAVAAPIFLGGRLWGAVIVSSVVAEPFPPGAEQRIADFAELAAQALANAQARSDLAASRARIVQAGDAERRRLERNLHDGAQQRLVSLALMLRLAARRHPDDADLRNAGEELSHALKELRELARGIHPAVLTERGLEPAVRALADRAPLPVELDVCIQERLPDPVEAAAYYVVAEALTNVAKYAQASEVSVELERGNGHACIEVRDDGIGARSPAGAPACAGSPTAWRRSAGGSSSRVRPGPGRRCVPRSRLAAELLRAVTAALSADERGAPARRAAAREPAELGWDGGTLSIPVPGVGALLVPTPPPDDDLLAAAESVGAQIALWENDARGGSRRGGGRCSRSRSTRS